MILQVTSYAKNTYRLFCSYPCHKQKASQSKPHSSQNLSLWTPSHQLSTIWKQTVRIQTSHCNQSKLTTSGNYKIIFGKSEKYIECLCLFWPEESTAVVLVVIFTLSGCRLWFFFFLQHNFLVILPNNNVILIFVARMWKKYIGAIRPTVQKATLPWDLFQTEVYECIGEKQKGKIIEEN